MHTSARRFAKKKGAQAPAPDLQRLSVDNCMRALRKGRRSQQSQPSPSRQPAAKRPRRRIGPWQVFCADRLRTLRLLRPQERNLGASMADLAAEYRQLPDAEFQRLAGIAQHGAAAAGLSGRSALALSRRRVRRSSASSEGQLSALVAASYSAASAAIK